MKILLLEDNSFDSDLAYRKIKSEISRATIDVAESIAQAKKLLKNNYDLALLDIKLPDGYGTDFVMEIRKKQAHCVIIMVTGSDDEDIAIAALKMGADDYIVKKDNYLKYLSGIILTNMNNKGKREDIHSNTIHVLYMEHHLSDLDLTIHHFKRFAPQFQIQTATNVEDLMNILPLGPEVSCPIDILLLDYKLQGMDALEITRILKHERKLSIPIIIVTGQGNENIAIQALKLGADEYLVKRKNYLQRLPSLLTSAHQRNLLEKQQQKLNESELKYRLLFANNPQPMWIYDNETLQFLEVNKAAETHYGFSREEFLLMNLTQIHHDTEATTFLKGMKRSTPSNNFGTISRHKKKNGDIIVVEITSHTLLFNNRPSSHVLINDVTYRKQTEKALIESEIQFKSIFEDHAAMKLIIDPESGSIFRANRAAANYYGWSIEQLTNMKIHDLNTLPKKKIDEVFKKMQKQKQNQFEFCHRHADKTLTDVIVFSSTVNLQGKDYLHTIIYDISKRKKAESQLKILIASVEQSPVSIIITNTQGIIEYVNSRFVQNTGYNLDEIIGKNPRFLNSGMQPKEFFTEMWATILKGKRWQHEICNRKKNGELLWENVIISPLKNDNEITHFISVREDVSEKKKMIDELIIAKEKAEENDELKTAFLANMSHEIRTPMNAVLGFSQLLTDDKTSDEQRKVFSEYIKVNGESLVNIIDNIIDIAKIQSKQLTIRSVNFDLHFLFKELEAYYNAFLPRQGKGNIKLQFQLPPTNNNQNFIIETDEERLRQVLNNLISNAIKYTEKGSIHIGYTLENNGMRFFVKDTGVGIPEKILPQIFDNFVQYSNQYISRQKGTGLGLSISKELVALLGGQLKVDSIEGKGSTFYFDLPLKYQNKSIPKSVQPVENSLMLDLSAYCVLIVDDEESNYALNKRLLQKTRVKTEWAINGKIAVDMVDTNKYDLILMDIKMPVMDGIEATKIIKSSNKNIPIIIQTAFSMPELKLEAFDAGCDGFIIKPVSIDGFMVLVNKYITIIPEA